MPKVLRVSPYSGPVDPDGTVAVYDLQVSPVHAYSVGGVMVSNSKRVSLLDVNALLAHGAVANLRDASNIRGTKNEDYWLRFMQGHTPPEPGVPPQWRKFEAQLKAAGANLVPDGPRIRLLAMTNTDVGTLAGDREVTNGGTVDWKDGKMVPIPGGLFDKACFLGTTRIWTEHGLRRIDSIVKLKLRTRVWSYDFATSSFVLRPITGWYKNRTEIGVASSQFAEAAHYGDAVPYTCLVKAVAGTPEHVVYKPNGEKTTLGDATTLTVVSEKFSDAAKQVLYGSLLGDLHVNHRGGMAASHSPKQRLWLEWKLQALGEDPEKIYVTSGVVRGKTYEAARYGSHTHPEYREARRLCYNAAGVKVITRAWLDMLDSRALAVWFGDDGSTDNTGQKTRIRLKLSTECFSGGEIQLLRDWLQARWGVKTSLSRNNARYRDRDMGWVIKINGSAATRFAELIAPHSHPILAYKLGEEPIRVCVDCGCRVYRSVQRCNVCTVDLPDQANGKVRSSTTHRFKSVAVREMRESRDIPAELPGDSRWHRLRAVWGTASDDFLAECSRIRTLREVPAEYRPGEFAWHSEIRTVYDIEVEGTHNYFANGVLVSNCTGSHGGGQWAKYTPSEPMPSPVFEEPIKKLLGLTGPQFEDIIAGRRELDKHGSGFGAIGKALDAIDVDRELARSRAEIASGRKSKRSDAVSRLRYLKSAKAYDLHPRDWMLSAIPVLPPEFRPVSTMAGGTPLVDDANYLYAQMIDADKTLRGLKEHVGDGGTGEERMRLYDSFRQVTGLAAPSHPKLAQKKVTGFLGKVFGRSPKHGCFDTETEILTELRGWVKRDGLDIDDRVATLNRETGAFEWQSIIEMHDYDYCGWMVSVKTDRALDVLVSPEHRNWVRRRNTKTGGADNIETGWDFEEAYKTAAAPQAARAWFRTAASGWVGSWNGFPKFLGETDRLKFAEFVGWWVAEGNLSERDKSVVQLSQSPTKNAAKCARIQKCVDALGLPVSQGDYMVQPPKGPKVKMRSWSIKSKPLAEWLQRHCGELSRGKFLSARVRSWPTEGLKAILVGYGGGDGSTKVRVNDGGKTHKNNTGNSLAQSTTTSRRLVDSLQEIACKIGWTVRFSRNIRGNDRPTYRAYYSGSRFTVLDNAEKGLAWYEGKIWCVSVANEVVLVRRNGRPFFSGNSLQRRLLGTTVDNTGRGVITVNPDLDMDSVGLPKDAAYDVFQKFITRRLVRGGMGVSRALEEIKQRTPRAADALMKEMEERPVLLTRAPVWHKYGIQAFRPRLTAHNVIEISPLVTKGFGADFDGDMQTFHVPSTDDAVKEAYEKLLPSRNVIGPADRRTPMFQPTRDLLAGLVKATDESEASDRAPRHFATKADVLRALASGEISHNDRVVVVGEKG